MSDPQPKDVGQPTNDSAPTASPQSASEERTDGQVGRYKLLQKIGEGGCGTVYLAEQSEPVRRRVAVKVIKLGMDTKEVIARFEAERQALAMMDHPNIAKVYDAGTTESGRPYFVMELVQGVPITAFCDEKKLPTAARLELFIQVCHAVQHAHQKGIIHRDIKPSNIMVAMHDDTPVPKVIDFGIAKATAGRLTDQTLYTAVEQFIGTPAYMSPEQAQLSLVDVDMRSDIYSLGVLLYELLTGHTPFDTAELLKVGLDEMRRHIREVEPPRPSTRLNTLQGEALSATAHRRRITPPKLLSLVRGDLDWIVMRCLEKDRARRYETANNLASDIKRHLGNEPVTARPPSVIYRARKLCFRYRYALIAPTVALVALVAGLILSRHILREAPPEPVRPTTEVAAPTVAKAPPDMKSSPDLPFVRAADGRILPSNPWSVVVDHIFAIIAELPEPQLAIAVTVNKKSAKVNVTLPETNVVQAVRNATEMAEQLRRSPNTANLGFNQAVFTSTPTRDRKTSGFQVQLELKPHRGDPQQIAATRARTAGMLGAKRKFACSFTVAFLAQSQLTEDLGVPAASLISPSQVGANLSHFYRAESETVVRLAELLPVDAQLPWDGHKAVVFGLTIEGAYGGIMAYLRSIQATLPFGEIVEFNVKEVTPPSER